MKIKIYTITLLLSAVLGSCSSSFLDEKPLDFMSATNSFLTQEDIDCSINNLYYLIRREFYGTDIVYDGEPNGTERHSNMISAYHSTGNIASVHWSLLYHTISTANTIIDRLPVSEVSEEQKTIAEAKARFFRGFAYRTLAYLYGGVPLLLTEVIEPKFDYVRASKEEVLRLLIYPVCPVCRMEKFLMRLHIICFQNFIWQQLNIRKRWMLLQQSSMIRLPD